MRKEFYAIGVFILLIWAVFVFDTLIPIELTRWGLKPRSLTGLLGIPLMPMLHGSWGHLVRNTVPLVVLLSLLVASRKNAWAIGLAIVLGNGILLWLFGRSANHIGASGLVFGLIAFLIVVGLREKRPVPLGIAVLVGFFYGGTLLSGVIPGWQSGTSWDGHLFGMIAGGVAGFAMTGRDARM